MEIKTIGVLAIIDKHGEILGIVYHKELERNQLIYICEKAGMDEIEKLLNNLVNKE